MGAQWGDEGKGKIVDILTEHYDVVARACGGANAGHTIVVGGKKHVFHLLPSGSLHDHVQVFLGAGMVIHLSTLLRELQTLHDAGIDLLPRLVISSAAHIVFDFHQAIDAKEEEQKAKAGGAIGTTKRGIGPAYRDKAGRTGLRMETLLLPVEELKSAVRSRCQLAAQTFGVTVDKEKEIQQLLAAKTALESCVSVNTLWTLDRIDAGKRVIIEGAQATLLDLDHGTYPYVTSSFTTIAGALQGLALPPQVLSSCIGVAKAYCTRVGGGTFLTEAEEAAAHRLRERGGEYGSTTGRPRRCGWLHLPDLQFAARLNRITHWNITKLDVLDEEAVLPVGTAETNGKAEYEEHAGWQTSTVGVTRFEDLPANAQTYLLAIEKKTGVPVSLIGTGPGREQMVVR